MPFSGNNVFAYRTLIIGHAILSIAALLVTCADSPTDENPKIRHPSLLQQWYSAGVWVNMAACFQTLVFCLTYFSFACWGGYKTAGPRRSGFSFTVDFIAIIAGCLWFVGAVCSTIWLKDSFHVKATDTWQSPHGVGEIQGAQMGKAWALLSFGWIEFILFIPFWAATAYSYNKYRHQLPLRPAPPPRPVPVPPPPSLNRSTNTTQNTSSHGEGESDHRPSGDGPSGDGPSGDGPSGDGPSGDGPSGGGPTDDRPTDDRPTDDRPTDNMPTVLERPTDIELDKLPRPDQEQQSPQASSVYSDQPQTESERSNNEKQPRPLSWEDSPSLAEQSHTQGEQSNKGKQPSWHSQQTTTTQPHQPHTLGDSSNSRTRPSESGTRSSSNPPAPPIPPRSTSRRYSQNINPPSANPPNANQRRRRSESDEPLAPGQRPPPNTEGLHGRSPRTWTTADLDIGDMPDWLARLQEFASFTN